MFILYNVGVVVFYCFVGMGVVMGLFFFVVVRIKVIWSLGKNNRDGFIGFRLENISS